MNSPQIPPILVITGPTASGKTALAMRLAQHVPIEIISMDSALVYRGMDIGTAKPTSAERADVPHHLIDICEPIHSYSAAAFVRDCDSLSKDIRQRGKLPVIVGGTMMYLKAWLYGLDEMPTADAAVRASLDAQAAALGWPALHQRLAEIDQATAQRLSPNDGHRIQRALEVFELSGQALSAWQQTAKNPSLRVNATVLSLEPSSRAWLHQRIAQRFEQMLRLGFLDEMQVLRARGDLNLAMPSMRCVGYRQAWESLDGTAPMATLTERGVAATRQLAKRQLTWLRSFTKRKVLPCDVSDFELQAQRFCAAFAKDNS